MLLWDESGHLLLDSGHLFVKLLQPSHEVMIMVDLRREGAVFDAGQRRVHFCKLVPRGEEFPEILYGVWGSIIEAGRCMDLSSVVKGFTPLCLT